jgi:gelsolin
VWRIEKFHVKPIPPNTYGTLYSGDSYIVLKTNKKPDSDALYWDVHFWLGNHTTQDEAGTAAYKTVELDDHLHGAPVQHREVQGYETPLFLSYFPKGVRILDGGIESGFHHVGPENYRPRLLQFKGKKHVRVTEVPFTYKSLNSGDVFIIDAGVKIIQWNGGKSSGSERVRAAQITESLVEERQGHAKHSVVSEGEKDESDFLGLLPDKGPIASAEAGGSDVEADHGAEGIKKLFRLHEDGGKFTFKQVSEGLKIHKADLDPSDVFILDTGYEVIAWIGAKSSAGEKKEALGHAQNYVDHSGKPPHTPVSRILEGHENEAWTNIVH